VPRRSEPLRPRTGLKAPGLRRGSCIAVCMASIAPAVTLPIATPSNGAVASHIPRPLTVQSFGATDTGKERTSNEDQFVIATLMGALWIEGSSVPQPNVHYGSDRGHVFIVADGVGGSKAGGHASALAVGAVEGFLLHALRWLLALDGSAEASVLNDFKAAIRDADACVYAAAASDPGLRGMGTTLTLAYSVGADLFVAHAGDSRCYRVRAGSLHQLTHDDTLVQELVEKGVVQPADAAHHSLRHMITNVVGGKSPGVHAEVHRLALEPGDQLLLCTDGLTNMLPNDRIQAVIERGLAPKQVCAELIRLANDEGGADNVTVVVARYA
jgi:serine/threonine protein phosphatase PrpC